VVGSLNLLSRIYIKQRKEEGGRRKEERGKRKGVQVESLI
jgi:hypothetical protein